MIIEEKYITLKDGRRALLRSPMISDAQTQSDFMARISRETDVLLRGADDPVMSVEDEEKFIENNRNSESNAMVCCFIEEESGWRYAASCGVSYNPRKKIAHRANLGISVLKEFWGLGIGTALMNEAENIARGWGKIQLELEYIEGNSRARALYEKCGFRIAGIHPDAFLMPDGSLCNEYLMIKKL